MNNLLDEITEPITKRVATGLSKIAMALRSHAWQEAGARGLTPTQGQILLFLRQQPDQSAMLSTISYAVFCLKKKTVDDADTAERQRAEAGGGMCIAMSI